MTDPWLSVVMPTYQGARFVAQAIESVRAQGNGGVEIVAVDDGSTDGTVELLRGFAASIPLRVLQPLRTGNWIRGTNLGLAVAKAPFACVLHQDDFWLAGRLAAIRAEVEERPALVVHPSLFVDARGRTIGTWRCPLPRRRGQVDPHLFVSRLLVQNFLAMPAPVFDRALALESGGLDESLWFTGDWDLWLRLARRGPIRYLPQTLAAFRVHPESQTVARASDAPERRRQLETVLARHRDVAAGSAAVRRAAAFSVEMNLLLAAAARGEKVRALPLLSAFARLGPGAQARYLRDSRIVERVMARVRLRRVT